MLNLYQTMFNIRVERPLTLKDYRIIREHQRKKLFNGRYLTRKGASLIDYLVRNYPFFFSPNWGQLLDEYERFIQDRHNGLMKQHSKYNFGI